ncbi:hypothetical protein HJFPF1_11806 [Paramyrothecium foliicola]|nr:hypothetical protein HJFPF1_11806 [Paramyrothecium foliicola]
MNSNEEPSGEHDDFDDEWDDDPRVTLSAIKVSKTINFSIQANYTNWEPREAFRELRRRDAIIKSFNLEEKSFTVILEEKTSGDHIDIVYKVPNPCVGSEEQEWLGYIRFEGHNGEGTIDICNRSATLQPWHLDLGGTSKANVSDQAGSHGEGLKLAALVLMRGNQNHCLRCRSGGFNWRFNFTTSGRLVVRLRRISRALLKKESKASSLPGLLPFKPQPAQDVQFIVGEKPKGRERNRDQLGNEIERRQVRVADFKQWTMAALFLWGKKEGIISTSLGDLLIDPELRGSIFLKGLLLSTSRNKSASCTGQPLKFGYNFSTGRTNRERLSMANSFEEAKGILAIWNKALVSNPELVKELSDMLNTDLNRPADVSRAVEFLQPEIAIRLKQYLCNGESADRWYYSVKDENKNPRLKQIINGLNREAFQLSEPYWKIMRQKPLLRTAVEEEQLRFQNAIPRPLPNTTFASAVSRLLRACLSACQQTQETTIEFIQAGELCLDLHFNQETRVLRIHERWLSCQWASGTIGLPDGTMEGDIVFHSVKKLFSEAIQQLPLSSFLSTGSVVEGEQQRNLEESRADQRLLEYLCFDKVANINVSNSLSLTVEWSSGNRSTSDVKYQIQCHKAFYCSGLRNTTLTYEDLNMGPCKQGNIYPCCPLPRSGLTVSKHEQTNLRDGEKYFFIVVPEQAGSIVWFSEDKTACVLANEPSVNFTRGSKIDCVDFYQVDKDQWYNGTDPDNAKAIIGMVNGSNAPQIPVRKRPRVVVEDEDDED